MSQWISNCQLTHAKSWNDRLLQKATNNAEFRTYCAFYLPLKVPLFVRTPFVSKWKQHQISTQGALFPRALSETQSPCQRPTTYNSSQAWRISEKYCMPGLLPLAELAQAELEWTRSIALIVSRCLEHENMLVELEVLAPSPLVLQWQLQCRAKEWKQFHWTQIKRFETFRHLTTLQQRQNRGEQCLILNRLLKTHEVDVTGPHRRYWTAIDCYMQH